VVKPGEVMGSPREGRKIVYTGDTSPFDGFAKFAHGADLVIHESTFDDALADKAQLDGHSTPSQAAGQAKAAGANQLALLHISARYSDATLLLEQAKKLFANTVVAEDFMVLELPLKDA
jgi:ribonuclease Z